MHASPFFLIFQLFLFFCELGTTKDSLEIAEGSQTDIVIMFRNRCKCCQLLCQVFVALRGLTLNCALYNTWNKGGEPKK